MTQMYLFILHVLFYHRGVHSTAHFSHILNAIVSPVEFIIFIFVMDVISCSVDTFSKTGF